MVLSYSVLSYIVYRLHTVQMKTEMKSDCIPISENTDGENELSNWIIEEENVVRARLKL